MLNSLGFSSGTSYWWVSIAYNLLSKGDNLNSQGLPVDKVFAGGIDDAQRMWVSSNQGVMLTTMQQVTAYLKGDTNTVVFDHFKAEDGLASIQINGGSQPSLDIDAHGNVWFATAKGLATVNPSNLERISDFSVPVIIEQVLLDGKS